MKAKIVFEFEVGDLVEFSDPTSLECQTNIFDVFHDMVSERMEKRTDAMAAPAGDRNDAYIASLDNEVTLVKRIVAGLKYIGPVE